MEYTILVCETCGKEYKIQHINPLILDAWYCISCAGKLTIKKEGGVKNETQRKNF